MVDNLHIIQAVKQYEQDMISDWISQLKFWIMKYLEHIWLSTSVLS